MRQGRRKGSTGRSTRRATPEVIALLADGESIQSIAKRVGLCRITVMRIEKDALGFSSEQWQDAVDSAYFALVLDASFQYGLVQWDDGTKDSGVDVERARLVLARGKARGYYPVKEQVA